MAVSVNTVYQTVLALANKEQRGYITPQEFNLFAEQAQLEIFEQYFYDLSQFRRRPGNDTGYADTIDMINEKLEGFSEYNREVAFDTEGKAAINGALPGLYRMLDLQVFYASKNKNTKAEELTLKEAGVYGESPLTGPAKSRPIFKRFLNNGVHRLQVLPTPVSTSGDKVYASYIRKPVTPNWTYVVVNGKALWNPQNAQDFELHISEQQNLVIKILKLAGVAIQQGDLVQAAASEEIKNIQQQKA